MKNSNMPVSPIFGSNGRVQPFTDDQGFSSMATGLTKREYFAGLVLSGVISKFATITDREEVIAKIAVNMADALLKELSNNEK